jgi:hypothetical protein
MVHTANDEHGAPKRPLNELFASDFVKHEGAETLKREKSASAWPFCGAQWRKKRVQVTDAADLEIGTRNMTFVFFSSRGYKRRERLGKEERGRKFKRWLLYEPCRSADQNEGGIVQRPNQYIHYAAKTQRPDKVNYDTEGLLAGISS